LIETNNLLVETLAIGSAFSAENDEQRPFQLSGERPALGVIRVPDGSFRGPSIGDCAER
jgi:hypothetical protein